jgi:Lhr-like helicase
MNNAHRQNTATAYAVMSPPYARPHAIYLLFVCCQYSAESYTFALNWTRRAEYHWRAVIFRIAGQSYFHNILPNIDTQPHLIVIGHFLLACHISSLHRDIRQNVEQAIAMNITASRYVYCHYPSYACPFHYIEDATISLRHMAPPCFTPRY